MRYAWMWWGLAACAHPVGSPVDGDDPLGDTASGVHDDTGGGGGGGGTDADGDGFGSDDCDDADADVYPGAPEICGDGRVNDCDGDEATAEAACRLVGVRWVDAADARFQGDGTCEHGGEEVHGPGDTNGDQLADVLIGSPREADLGDRTGEASLFLGTPRGTLSLETDAWATFSGEAAGDEAGHALGSGDWNSDGLQDIAIGAPGWGEHDNGAAYVWFGPIATGDYKLAASPIVIRGGPPYDQLGSDVAGAGDVDGDGDAELLVGAMGSSWDVPRGGAYVFAGPLGPGTLDAGDAAIHLVSPDLHLAGATVDGPGDVDGDGLADLLIGCGEGYDATGAGGAWLARAPLSGTVDLADTDAFLGTRDWQHVGISVSAAGDMNGDGLRDIAIGATGDAAVYVLFGPVTHGLSTADLRLDGDPAAGVGASVAAADDVDGDGSDDLLVGGPTDDEGGIYAGATWIVYGPASGVVSLASVDAKILGHEGSWSAQSIAGAHDVDSDGHADLLIGAALQDAGARDSGSAYLFLPSGL